MKETSFEKIETTKQSQDPAVAVEDSELRRVETDTELVSKEISKDIKFYGASTKDYQDVANPTTRKGWGDYWKKRLVPEIDILPENISNIVRNFLQKTKMTTKEFTELQNYVNKRVGILKFEINKKEEMARLKKRLTEIDKGESYDEQERAGRRTVFYDQNDDSIFVLEKGEKKIITLGDIVADAEWGIKYYPDDSVPREIWRKIRKISDIREARRNVENIFNNQLASIEGIQATTTSLNSNFIEQYFDKDPAIRGIIAEFMVKNFLTRLQFKKPSLGLRVESVNIFEDAELKYDFKVQIVNHMRGVAVEGDDMSREEYVKEKQRIGIQLTVSENPHALQKKQEQITTAKSKIESQRASRFVKKKVEDIVVVSLPFTTYKDYFQKWLDQGKPSGGPEQYMSHEEKLAVLAEVGKGKINLTEKDFDELDL